MARTLGEYLDNWSKAHDSVRWINELKRRTLGLEAAATLNFPNTSAQTSADLTVSVPGAALGDFVEVSAPVVSLAANSLYTAFVSDADEVTVRFHNYSAGAINPAEGEFRLRAKRGSL